jgi:dTDP-4-dehydrorhamnose 3,5-epimerase
MNIIKTKFKNALIIIPEVFRDNRGDYLETFNLREYDKILPTAQDFVQDDVSISYKNVLRGLHGNFETWKLVQCLNGLIYSVIVDNNSTSPTYLQWESFYLTDSDYCQLLIPPGFGNSILALSSKVIYSYKQTTYYDRSSQFTLAWNDPKLNISWPIDDPILSERDRTAPLL